MIAMSTYRSYASYESRFARAHDGGAFVVEQWLRRHGDRLAARFDAKTYVTLTDALDSHDLARGRGHYEAVVASIRQPALIIGIDSDVLYPPREQEELAILMPNVTLRTIRSLHGHDGFLIDAAKIEEEVREWRRLVRRARRPRSATAASAPPADRPATSALPRCGSRDSPS
jgi:homoserine O-acetyltransferase